MTYAFITDGMDDERREQFDLALEEGPEKAKARKERESMERMMGMLK